MIRHWYLHGKWKIYMLYILYIDDQNDMDIFGLVWICDVCILNKCYANGVHVIYICDIDWLCAHHMWCLRFLVSSFPCFFFRRFFVSSFLRFLVSSFLRFLVSSFPRFFVSLFPRFFVSSFLCFLVSSFLRFFVSSFLRFFVSSFLRFFVFLCFLVSSFLCFLVSSFFCFLVSSCPLAGSRSQVGGAVSLCFFMVLEYFVLILLIFLFDTHPWSVGGKMGFCLDTKKKARRLRPKTSEEKTIFDQRKVNDFQMLPVTGVWACCCPSKLAQCRNVQESPPTAYHHCK